MTALADSPLATLSHDRLGFSFCLALALHAALILGISFNREDRSVAATKLEITLAQHRDRSAPQEADFLAQHNQQGSGTLTEKVQQTTVTRAAFSDNQIREVAPVQQTRRQTGQRSRHTAGDYPHRKHGASQQPAAPAGHATTAGIRRHRNQ